MEALKVLDSEPFQRLRYVRQLGHAYLVYPGATHTRFEHALGTYHLARRALSLLNERGELDSVSADERALARLGALLHDIGHYPFSHALEEAGLKSHESMATRHLEHPDIVEAISGIDLPDTASRITALIRGESDSPLQGLISGALDLDKIEYLTRDARMCGVPYGTVDVDRLLNSLTMVTLDGRSVVGVHEKGVSALESLLFAKYQMYRNVYWHHAVRSATAMFKRAVRGALERGLVTENTIATSTDEELVDLLRREDPTGLTTLLRKRKLFKRALDLPAAAVSDRHGIWISSRPDLVERLEDRLARELGLEPGRLLIDFPHKPEMLSFDLPVLTRDGRVDSLEGEVGRSLVGLRQIADELHTTARRFRVFVSEPVDIQPRKLLSWAELEEAEAESRLA